MSEVFQRWRRASSSSPQQGTQRQTLSTGTNTNTEAIPILDEESANDNHQPKIIRSKSSIPGYSKTPVRSFFHQASHGSHDPAQYSSLGVRAETGELASFALRDADSIRAGTPPRTHHFSSPEPDSVLGQYYSHGGGERPFRDSQLDGTITEAIEEVSEPVTPDEAPRKVTRLRQTTSTLSGLIRKSTPSSSTSVASFADREAQKTPESRDVPSVAVDALDPQELTEASPLLGKTQVQEQHYDELNEVESQKSYRRGSVRQYAQHSGRWDTLRTSPATTLQSIWQIPSRTWNLFRYKTAKIRRDGRTAIRKATNPKSWDSNIIYTEVVKKPVQAIPAVILGSMLNLLDGMSYGLLLFPLNYDVFASSGPDGISIFFVSTIISQLVFSIGFSKFKCGIGSEMIEIIPFCHQMATTIMTTVTDGDQQTILCTTQVAYAISVFLTGILFWLLGHFKCGNVVNYFPRHILIGSIAGVGLFLLKTGVQVSSPLDELDFTLDTLRRLFTGDAILLWTIPLFLALFLRITKRFITSALYDPAFFIAITLIFYIIVAAVPDWSIDSARAGGWIFPKTELDAPFYNFYLHYSWSKIHWEGIALCIPTMIALTFFGLLHVPINVPALALRVGEDDLDMNRELKAHGVSNCASGLAGSVQNYLVYANSDMVYRSGGNSRQAGLMIAAASVGLWVAGPGLIGFVPKPTVGALIYLLGLDLTMDSVWDTCGTMETLEWLSVVAMMLVMGFYDFVYGVILGIVLACLTIVINNSRKSSIEATYTGSIAQSTVRRHITQRRFLREAGYHTYVVKLAGFLFFGTIVDVENNIKALLEKDGATQKPIHYLIFDFRHVYGMDYSAAEAFERMKRSLDRRDIHMLFSGVNEDDDTGLAFRRGGLWTDNSGVGFFRTLNDALEMCENHFLKAFYQQQDVIAQHGSSKPLAVSPPNSAPVSHDVSFSSPRGRQLQEAANSTLKETQTRESSGGHDFAQPLPLLLQAFTGITSRNEDFWHSVTKYFERKQFAVGTTLYRYGEPAEGFYLVEEGTLKAVYNLPQGQYHESIVMGTTCGELPFFSETERTATVTAETDCVAWVLTIGAWKRLQSENSEGAQELLRIALRLTAERMKAVVSYVLMTS